mmetsp:Transcript_15690/g.39951  ORF Transcript_15690/g.39951 Transcript_15690/m.39951 type:complete len:223 (+) Transcript_15690:933-1601(+)
MWLLASSSSHWMYASLSATAGFELNSGCLAIIPGRCSLTKAETCSPCLPCPSYTPSSVHLASLWNGCIATARSWLIFATAPPGTGSSPGIDFAAMVVRSMSSTTGPTSCSEPPPYTDRRLCRSLILGSRTWLIVRRRSRKFFPFSGEPLTSPSTSAASESSSSISEWLTATILGFSCESGPCSLPPFVHAPPMSRVRGTCCSRRRSTDSLVAPRGARPSTTV